MLPIEGNDMTSKKTETPAARPTAPATGEKPLPPTPPPVVQTPDRVDTDLLELGDRRVVHAQKVAVSRRGMVATAHHRASEAGAEKLLRIGQILVGSQQALRHGVDARLQLELSFVRIGQLGQLLDAEGLLRRIERLEMSFTTSGGLAASPR